MACPGAMAYWWRGGHHEAPPFPAVVAAPVTGQEPRTWQAALVGHSPKYEPPFCKPQGMKGLLRAEMPRCIQNSPHSAKCPCRPANIAPPFRRLT